MTTKIASVNPLQTEKNDVNYLLYHVFVEETGWTWKQELYLHILNVYSFIILILHAALLFYTQVRMNELYTSQVGYDRDSS